MRVIGFSCGKKFGNTETLVKEALMACEEKGLEVDFVRLNDMVLEPCTVCNNGCVAGRDINACPHKDDANFLADKFLDADGYIIGAPAYSKTPNSYALVFRDRVFGPKMDLAFWQIRGEPEWAKGRGRARAGALISVGGAPTHHWVSMGIQCLYTTCFSAQTEVVDILDVNFRADKGACAIEDELCARAHKLGENVADAVITGDHKWRGDEGYACSVCHQNFVELKPGTNRAECPICGCLGTIKIKDDIVTFEIDDMHQNALSMEGKKYHDWEIKDVRENIYGPKKELADAKLQKYKDWEMHTLKSPTKEARKAEALAKAGK